MAHYFSLIQQQFQHWLQKSGLISKPLLLLVGISQLLLFNSCRSLSTARYDDFMARGDYAKAQTMSKKGDKLLWDLQAASASRAAGDFEESNRLFDLAEEQFNRYRASSNWPTYMAQLAQTLSNDTAFAYRGEVYEGMMINTYKALNFMSMKNWQYARVELNRAYERQRRAVEHYSDEIRASEELMRDYGYNFNLKRLMRRSSFQEIRDVVAYSDYVNPLINLIEGAYLLNKGDSADRDRADHTLRRLLSMSRSSEVEKARKSGQGKTWVLIENGQAMRKKEWRMDLPTFILRDVGIKELRGVNVVSVALPELVSVASRHHRFSVNSQSADLVADMDQMVKANHDQAFRGILTRALISATVKATAQYWSEKKWGQWGNIAVSILSAASTRADTRTWSGLAKNYHFALVENGGVEIKSAGKTLLKTQTKGASLLFVKVSTDGKVTSQVINFE